MKKKLIEVSMPLEAINAAAGREKSIRHGHPSTLHLWWARRPLAAARAVLFGQLVDDPSSWPELWRTEGEQIAERKRLHAIIAELVIWENSNDERVLNAARLEIARSHARTHPSPKGGAILAASATAALVNEYLATEVPPVHDPFAGGGSIPLEAQRLGLRAIASDLNPVAVLINKALIEIPPRFVGRPPVNPVSRAAKETVERQWRGAQGLAEDVRYYGKWVRGEAFKRIGHLYPDVELEKGKTATVIAWLWARTVASPDPAFRGEQVPLVSSFWLSTKEGKETWVDPVVDAKKWRFEVRTGKPKDTQAIGSGTKLGRGANFRCILSGKPIEADYVRAEARGGRMAARLMAMVVDGVRQRVYLSPREDQIVAANSAAPAWGPEELVTTPCHDVDRLPMYGMPRWRDAFTPRQLAALTTFSDLTQEARLHAKSDAIRGGQPDDGVRLCDGGNGADAYADALATYLAFAVDKVAEANSSICTWSSAAKNELVVSTFRRQAIPMTWDYAEANPFGGSSGNIDGAVAAVCRVIDELPSGPPGVAQQRDAATSQPALHLLSTDPPYYDNIGYADLSDFFYVWDRPTLGSVFPRLFTTVVVPKSEELIASQYRHGSKAAAETFFMKGMTAALSKLAQNLAPSAAAACYYAFKQSEGGDEAGGTSSTGWETFLEAVLQAGLTIEGTWPVRTERAGRTIEIGTNALASSVVLACRRRNPAAPQTSRAEFRRELRSTLPAAMRALVEGQLAPVDIAQAAIGPGMSVFSKYSAVLGTDSKPVSVKTALQLINEVLDEVLHEDDIGIDGDSRFALTWFETHQFDQAPFGDAETLAKARGVSVRGVEEAGIAKATAGKVRLLKRSELRDDYDPRLDSRPTVWEACQHLIKRLDEHGEESAAELLAALGENGPKARDLAYRLFSICDRKRWTDEARGYNHLASVWADLERLAQQRKGDPVAPSPIAKPKKQKPTKNSKQGELL